MLRVEITEADSRFLLSLYLLLKQYCINNYVLRQNNRTN